MYTRAHEAADAGVREILQQSLEGHEPAKSDALLLFEDCPTSALVSTAARIRDRAKPEPVVTYSRKIFIDLVNLCRDTCLYCTYKKEPSSQGATMMSPDAVLALAKQGQRTRCTEALIVTGERPEEKYAQAKSWLWSLGHSNLVDYIREVSELVLQNTGLLPHTNAGSLSKSELAQLKDTNVSVGVMLESSSERLMEKGMPHAGAPSKHPKVRLNTLSAAGELGIPTTTGLLVGIGESLEEMVDSLFVLRDLSRRYGHVQEIILQNFAPKPRTGMASSPAAGEDYFIRTLALARLVMQKMNIQAPPNLNPESYGLYLDAGINDWGGISPVTIDHVNPEFPWPSVSQVAEVSLARGRNLRGRLPVYPEFLKGGFISERLEAFTAVFVDSSGLVREEYFDDI